MKISVCIPVYNFDVRDLVKALLNEISKKNLNAEVILIDDASRQEIRAINSELENSVSKFIYLQENAGRSKIRNLFRGYICGDFLLFLDCDSGIIGQNFLSTYFDFIKENPTSEVVYGGRISSEKFTGKNYALRRKYASERENLPAKLRRKHPYRSFQTNNFMIARDLFCAINFNENFNDYGYEDLLFAMDLKAEGSVIWHIENPVVNNDLEENSVFLTKVEESVASLSAMLEDPLTKDKISSIKLAKVHEHLKKLKISRTFLIFFRPLETALKEMLLRSEVPLYFLDFYKLLLLEKSKNP